MKTKKIKLLYRSILAAAIHGCEGKPYEVEQISDSNEYHPGDMLTEKEVGFLCVDRRWNVTTNKGN